MNIHDTNPLSPEGRASWLRDAGNDLRSIFWRKYEAGAIEHNGDLGAVSTITLIDEMIAEHLDSLAYLFELKRRIRPSLPQEQQIIKIKPGEYHTVCAECEGAVGVVVSEANVVNNRIICNLCAAKHSVQSSSTYDSDDGGGAVDGGAIGVGF